MAYDVDLSHRLRALLSAESRISEKRMFGGLAFLLDGRMVVGANSHGGLMVRVDPAQRDALVEDPRARPLEMRGRPMAGWLHVDVDDSVSGEELRRWVELGLAEARLLPPK